MATELKISGMGGSTCQNVGTFVHRIPSATTTKTKSVIQFYNQPYNQRHTLCEKPPELKDTASVMMTSYKLDTGVFLQQFTNSVSRALHKQTCACSGRSYPPDELFLRSNPAIFAANVSESCSRQSTADSLPSVSRSGCVGKHKPARDSSTTKHLSSPNVKLEYEFVPRDNAIHCTRIKMLGDTSPMKRQKRQSNLPERINVTDKNGQNWQIIQNFPKHMKKSPSHQKSSCSSHELEFQTPPNTTRLGMNKQDTSERNTPRRGGIHLPKHITSETDITHSNTSLEFIQTSREAHSPGPPTSDVRIRDVESPHADAFLSSRSAPREADRKFILSLLNSAVRKRQITYEDFLQRASQLTSALSNRDNYGGMVEARNQNNNSPSSDLSEFKSGEVGGTHLPRLNAFDNAGEHCGPVQQALPSKLEDLYTRGRLKILKFDIERILPDNFLKKGRDELRQMYPMYDWRVGQGARLVNMTQSSVKRVVPDKKDSLATPCTLQLPKMFPKDKGKDLRAKARYHGRDTKGQKRLVRGERVAVTDRLETTKESKEENDEAASTAMEEELVEEDNEAMEEMRPCSGLFPRQPPPTPMESRRKQTLEIVKELD